jgi:hypothetical protein
VVDSSAVLSALFATDAGFGCGNLMLPTSVDYTTDRVVVVGGGSGLGSLTVYQVGSETVLDLAVDDDGPASPAVVYLVVLPVAATTSLELMTCTTTCSGICPG